MKETTRLVPCIEQRASRLILEADTFADERFLWALSQAVRRGGGCAVGYVQVDGTESRMFDIKLPTPD